MNARVTVLESSMQELNATLRDLSPLITRIDERMNYMATGEAVEKLRTELATKATRGTVWTTGVTMFCLVVAAAAVGAAYMPYIATLLRRIG